MITTLIIISLAYGPLVGELNPVVAQAVLAEVDDDDRPLGMSWDDWDDLVSSASLDTEDLYEDEWVTADEFAAQVAALDVEMAATIEANALIVYPGEE